MADLCANFLIYVFLYICKGKLKDIFFMKKLLILTAILFIAGILNPASAQTRDYKIKYEGSSMVIVPYSEVPAVQKSLPKIQSTPAKIPYYSNKLPKGKNKNYTA